MTFRLLVQNLLTYILLTDFHSCEIYNWTITYTCEVRRYSSVKIYRLNVLHQFQMDPDQISLRGGEWCMIGETLGAPVLIQKFRSQWSEARPVALSEVLHEH